MNAKWQSVVNVCEKAYKPVVGLGVLVLLFLQMKGCYHDSKETNKSDDMQATMSVVSSDVNQVRKDIDTIKADSRQTVKNTNDIKQTADDIKKDTKVIRKATDSLLTKVEDCCGCKKHPVVVKPKDKVVDTNKHVKPVNKDTVERSGTVYINIVNSFNNNNVNSNSDTVYEGKSKPVVDTPKMVLRCYIPVH